MILKVQDYEKFIVGSAIRGLGSFYYIFHAVCYTLVFLLWVL